MRTDNARTEIVDSAREAWIRRLIPTTRNNNLLYFRELQTGTLNLSQAESAAIADLFGGEKLALSRLVPPGYDPRAGAKLREIARKAQSNLEEKGLQTLFVAYGMATWCSSSMHATLQRRSKAKISNQARSEIEVWGSLPTIRASEFWLQLKRKTWRLRANVSETAS